MTFIEISPGVYQSDAGFSVQITPSWPPYIHFIYRENGRTLEVGGESSGSTFGALLRPVMNPRWNLPHRSEPISLAQYATIILNIKAAFNYLQEPLEIESNGASDPGLFALLKQAKPPVFYLPKPNICDCEEGFSIEFNGKSPILYRSGTKVLSIPCDEVRHGAKTRLKFAENEVIEDYSLIVSRIELAIIYLKREECWPPSKAWRVFMLGSSWQPRNKRFSVKILRGTAPAATLIYREHDQVLRVELDIRPGGVENCRWNKAWDQPFEHDPLDQEKLAEIDSNIHNVIDHMRESGEWPPSLNAK